MSSVKVKLFAFVESSEMKWLSTGGRYVLVGSRYRLPIRLVSRTPRYCKAKQVPHLMIASVGGLLTLPLSGRREGNSFE
jgi:hypothetical protein